MTIQPLSPGDAAHRKEIIYYATVLLLISVVSIIAGILSNPAVGIAVFVALSKLLLPKKAPFWRNHGH